MTQEAGSQVPAQGRCRDDPTIVKARRSALRAAKTWLASRLLEVISPNTFPLYRIMGLIKCCGLSYAATGSDVAQTASTRILFHEELHTSRTLRLTPRKNCPAS